MSLRGPIIRDRHVALRALTTWESLPGDIAVAVTQAGAIEPDEAVKSAMERLFWGEPVDVIDDTG
ncbi:MAG: hypothetical protein GKR94_20795 [Gammaproteobacteria bacterium]|nr:hypothetical protein [Gammaproteobacteria bacterium]